MSIQAFEIGTTIMDHLQKGRYLALTPKNYLFEDVTLVILKNRRGNPKLIGYSDCVKRYGVIPIFYTSQGIIVPRKCKIPFDSKHHSYNNPQPYYINTIKRALKNFFKNSPHVISEALIEGVLRLRTPEEQLDPKFLETEEVTFTQFNDPMVNLIPFFSENFGHELCQLLSLYEEYLTSHPQTTHDATNPKTSNQNKTTTKTLIYQNYPHLIQANEYFSKLQNLEPQLVSQFNHVFKFKTLEFIPTRMRAFPDASLRPAINYLMDNLPKFDQEPITHLAMVKTQDSRLFAANGPMKNKTPQGCFVSQVKSHINNHTPFQVIEHEKMDLITILNYLKHSQYTLLSYGAMAYWSMFLAQTNQPCLVLLNKYYKGERQMFRGRVCFDPELYNNCYYSKALIKDVGQKGLADWVNNTYKSITQNQ